MDVQFNVESEPRDTLAATVNGRESHSHIVGEFHDEPTFDCRYSSVNFLI